MPAGNSPAGHNSNDLPETTGAITTPEQPGSIVGRYKLRELIGEGGMGTVWIAEQTEPVRRKVAVKLVKPGMDTKEVLSRFQVERQALALMDHPNIAKVHDGGVTGTGRPYFVMEYVKGIPITQYCDEARLTVKQRLELFVDVCQAVQHAHQKGIIHRDLKPSNILVCLYDGKPIPKIIDFGLAKAMHQPLTEHTLYTAHGLMVGTPQYMSPEQAEFNNLDVDTRTDVYSLGVILYELLTGTTPLERRRVKEAAVQEILRLIKEEDPPKPSTKISGSMSLQNLAAQRSLEPTQLSRLVRGDLDWIAMKSLEKDRSRRYETASGLARDVQRYLSDEPVEACPPSLGYKLRKLAARNKRALATFSLLSVVVLAALAVAAGSVGWVVRDRLNREAGVARQIRSALDEVASAVKLDRFSDADLSLKQAEGLLPSSGSQPSIVAEVQRWRADLKLLAALEAIQLQRTGDPQDHANRAALAAGYRRAFAEYGIDLEQSTLDQSVERIRESPLKLQFVPALDDWFLLWRTSEASGEQHQRLRMIVTRVDDNPWRAQARDAVASMDLTSLQKLRNDDNAWQSQPPLTLAILAEQLLLRDDEDSAYEVLADHFLDHALQDNPDHFVAHLTKGWGAIQSAPAEAMRHLEPCRNQSPENPGVRVALALAYFPLYEDTIYPEAELRTATRIRANYATAHAELGRVLHYNVMQLQRRDQLEECIQELRLAIRLDPALPTPCDPLTEILLKEKRLDQAEEIYRTAYDQHPSAVHLGESLGEVLLAEDKWKEAELVLSPLVEPSAASMRALIHLAQAQEKQRNIASAEKTLRIAIERFPKASPPWAELAELLQRQNQLEAAQAAMQEALKIDANDPELQAARDLLQLTTELTKIPDNADLLAERGLRNLSQDRAKAAADLMRAVELPEAKYNSRRSTPEQAARRWLGVGQALLTLRLQEQAAIALRRSLTIAEEIQASNAHDPAILEIIAATCVRLGDSLWKAENPGEATSFFDRAMRLDSRTAVDAHRAGGMFRLAHGEWDAGAMHLTIVVENRPQDHLLAMQTAVLHLFRKDRAGYDSICRIMLEHYGDAKDPILADRTAKACLLGKPPAGDLQTLQLLAETTVVDPTHGFYRYFVLVRALSAYRAGDWQATREWCLKGQKQIGTATDVPFLVAHYLVLQAMAEQQLGSSDLYQKCLTDAASIIAQTFPEAPANTGAGWPEWQLYEVLRREAQELESAAEKTLSP